MIEYLRGSASWQSPRQSSPVVRAPVSSTPNVPSQGPSRLRLSRAQSTEETFDSTNTSMNASQTLSNLSQSSSSTRRSGRAVKQSHGKGLVPACAPAPERSSRATAEGSSKKSTTKASSSQQGPSSKGQTPASQSQPRPAKPVNKVVASLSQTEARPRQRTSSSQPLPELPPSSAPPLRRRASSTQPGKTPARIGPGQIGVRRGFNSTVKRPAPITAELKLSPYVPRPASPTDDPLLLRPAPSEGRLPRWASGYEDVEANDTFAGVRDRSRKQASRKQVVSVDEFLDRELGLDAEEGDNVAAEEAAVEQPTPQQQSEQRASATQEQESVLEKFERLEKQLAQQQSQAADPSDQYDAGVDFFDGTAAQESDGEDEPADERTEEPEQAYRAATLAPATGPIDDSPQREVDSLDENLPDRSVDQTVDESVAAEPVHVEQEIPQAASEREGAESSLVYVPRQHLEDSVEEQPETSAADKISEQLEADMSMLSVHAAEQEDQEDVDCSMEAVHDISVKAQDHQELEQADKVSNPDAEVVQGDAGVAQEVDASGSMDTGLDDSQQASQDSFSQESAADADEDEQEVEGAAELSLSIAAPRVQTDEDEAESEAKEESSSVLSTEATHQEKGVQEASLPEQESEADISAPFQMQMQLAETEQSDDDEEAPQDLQSGTQVSKDGNQSLGLHSHALIPPASVSVQPASPSQTSRQEHSYVHSNSERSAMHALVRPTPIVEVISADATAAARAAAILRVHHKWIHEGITVTGEDGHEQTYTGNVLNGGISTDESADSMLAAAEQRLRCKSATPRRAELPNSDSSPNTTPCAPGGYNFSPAPSVSSLAPPAPQPAGRRSPGVDLRAMYLDSSLVFPREAWQALDKTFRHSIRSIAAKEGQALSRRPSPLELRVAARTISRESVVDGFLDTYHLDKARLRKRWSYSSLVKSVRALQRKWFIQLESKYPGSLTPEEAELAERPADDVSSVTGLSSPALSQTSEWSVTRQGATESTTTPSRVVRQGSLLGHSTPLAGRARSPLAQSALPPSPLASVANTPAREVPAIETEREMEQCRPSLVATLGRRLSNMMDSRDSIQPAAEAETDDDEREVEDMTADVIELPREPKINKEADVQATSLYPALPSASFVPPPPPREPTTADLSAASARALREGSHPSAVTVSTAPRGRSSGAPCAADSSSDQSNSSLLAHEAAVVAARMVAKRQLTSMRDLNTHGSAAPSATQISRGWISPRKKRLSERANGPISPRRFVNADTSSNVPPTKRAVWQQRCLDNANTSMPIAPKPVTRNPLPVDVRSAAISSGMYPSNSLRSSSPASSSDAPSSTNTGRRLATATTGGNQGSSFVAPTLLVALSSSDLAATLDKAQSLAQARRGINWTSPLSKRRRDAAAATLPKIPVGGKMNVRESVVEKENSLEASFEENSSGRMLFGKRMLSQGSTMMSGPNRSL